MDLFDLIGPIMVGPSSSHTAGAARIGLVARKLLGAKPVYAKLMLHGSFAATGSGHGTDRALIAGLLGMQPDDERIPASFELAEKEGLRFEFSDTELKNAHPNSVKINLTGENGEYVELIAASIGGGRIKVCELSGMELSFSAEKPTLIVRNEDQPGSVADVSRILAECGINIATFQVNRSSRGADAIMVIECDTPVTDELCGRIRALPGILKAVCIN